MRFKTCIYFLLVCLAIFPARKGYGQIIPDTSLNHPIPPQARVQADTIHMYADTVKITPVRPLPWEPKPKRAGLYSAILPGAGQIYNRQYWKLPIVYGGLGAGVYFIQDNRKQYRKYRQAYLYRIDNDPSTKDADAEIAQYTTDTLRELQNEYRKNADLSVLLTAVGYTLHIMDAVASAHLRNFDISRDISLQMKPMLHSNGIGLELAMNFK